MSRASLSQREKASSSKKHWVRLTRACNNRCIFCLDKEPQDGSVLPLAQIKKYLGEGLKNGCRQVVLSGGEATIHPEFINIVALAKKTGYNKIQVISNGRMFAYGKFLQEAVKAGLNEITFSMHGHNAALHDSQTGIRGSFKQALAGLGNALKQPGLIVNIDTVINKQNYKQLADIIKFFTALGVHEFDLLQIIPFGRAWDNRDKLFYDVEQAAPHLKEAFELSKNEDSFIWTNRFPARYLEGYEELIQNPKKILDEVRGRRKLFADYLESGKAPDCYPAKCQFCFLEDFCRDLRELKTKGRLESQRPPLCLPAKKEPARKLSLNKNTDINDFAEFFINSRYFVKGSACSGCSGGEKCQGAHINIIRQKGFKILKPLR